MRPASRSLRRSLVWCSLEGISASVVGACSSGAVLTAWAVYLGASPLLLATLWGVPYLAQAAQPLAAWLTSRFGPKRVAVVASGLSRQVLWIVAVLPLVPSRHAWHEGLVACIAVMAVAAVIGGNAWTSWVAVLVPAPLRGRYFGPRTARITVAGTLAALAVGAWIDWAGARGHTLQAIAVTFAAGAAFGLVCIFLMNRQQAVPASPPVDVRGLLAPLRDAPARRILAFQVVWNVSTGIAASLYGAHALSSLGLGVTGLAVYTTSLALVRAGAMPVWGRALDRFGARPVLVACALTSACGSALWLALAPGRLWPMALDVLVSGVALGGIDLATFMLPITLAGTAQVPALVAATSMASGTAFGVASIAGGALLSAWTGGATSACVAALFAASALGRVLAALLAARLGQREASA